MPPTRTWKAKEIQGARFFGAERNPGSGAHRHHTSSDSLHPILYLEQKYRNILKTSGWFRGLFQFWRKEKDKSLLDGKEALVLINHYYKQPGFLITVHSDDMPIVVCEYLRARGFNLTPDDIEGPANETTGSTRYGNNG